MSMRSMLEINHDFSPYTDEEKEKWLKSMLAYFACGNPKHLPEGVTWFGMRHHTQPCLLDAPQQSST